MFISSIRGHGVCKDREVATDDEGERDMVIYRSLVEDAGDLIVAFADDGTIVFANRAIEVTLGFSPDEVVGRNVFEFVHEDDLERALRALELNNQFGSAPGTTTFRLRHHDGSWVPVDMTGGHATDDGERTLFSSISRVAEDREAMSQTLVNLLGGAPLADVLRPVCDMFAWRSNGSHIGISWLDGRGERGTVSTGIDPDLVGGHDGAGTPWDEVRKTRTSITDLDLSRLDPDRRDAALAAGMGAYWIEPITSGVDEPALITVWTKYESRPPLNHALAMETAHYIVEVILRWAEQKRRLDHAAYHDALTGLANRKAFFEAIAGSTTGGAILYCDLDRFKPVNDRLGHAAGDELLQFVAARLQGCVGRDDVVARIGGDEFAVLCPGMRAEDAAALSRQIASAMELPFVIEGEQVEVGISVGVAHDAHRLTEGLLEQADQRLYVDKDARRTARAVNQP